MRNGICFPRRNAECRTSGNASSFWPTVVRGDADKNCINTTYSNGDPHLLAAAAMWATPNLPSGGRVLPPGTTLRGASAYLADGRKRQLDLQNQVLHWPTPAARDTGGVNSPESYEKRTRLRGFRQLQNKVNYATGQADQAKSSTLGKPRESWSTPRVHDNRSGKDLQTQGKPSLKTQVSQRRGWKLNPIWVESLMGLPAGWTLPLSGHGRDDVFECEICGNFAELQCCPHCLFMVCDECFVSGACVECAAGWEDENVE